MNFSIFDGTFGFVDRITTIQGSGNDNTVTGGSQSWFRDQIRAAMNENFIGTAAVRVSKSGSNVVFEIEVLNSTNASSEQIRQMVQQSVANKQYAYTIPVMTGIIQGRYILSNVTTRVLSDTGAPVQTGGNTTQPPTYFPFPSPPTAGTTQPPPSGTGSGFVDNLGLGLGISTPVVVGGAALLLLLILKK